MPKFKRWHPVSHDFNRDPQILELRRKFGNWMALVWLECLSIGDRNEGIIPGSLEEIAEILARVSDKKYSKPASERVQNCLRMVAEWSWIEIRNDSIRIVNFVKYHKPRGTNRVPSEPSEPSESYIKKYKITKKTKLPDDFAVNEGDRVYASSHGFRSPDILIEGFIEHALKVGARYADWDMAFKNWIRNDTERFGGKQLSEEEEIPPEWKPRNK